MKYKGRLGALILLACHSAVAQLSITSDPTLGGLLPANRPAPTLPPPATPAQPPASAEQQIANALQVISARVGNGQMQEALSASMEVLRFAETSFGKESLMVARRCMDVATIHRLIGNYNEAMGWAEKAVGLEQKIGDTKGVDYAMNVQRLGEIYLDVAQDAAATRAFTQSYEVLKSKLPETDPAVVTAIHNLGVASYQGRRPDAKELLSKALALREKSEGKDSIPVAFSSGMLGRALFRERDFAGAEALMRRALQIFRQHEKQQAAMVSRTLDDLTLLLIESGELTKAEECLRENEETTTRLFGEAHQVRQALLQRRGELHRARGELEEAEKFFVRALDFHTIQYGEKSASAVNANLYLAGFYEQTGAVEKAEKHYLQALKNVEAAAGAESGVAVQLHATLGDFYYKTMNDLARAEASYVRALDIVTNAKLGQAPMLKLQVAKICIATGRTDEAVHLLQMLLNEAEASGQEGTLLANAARITLSELRGNSAYLTEVIRHNGEFLKQLEAQLKQNPASGAELARACVDLAEPCLAARRPVDAEKWSRRALDVCQQYFAPTHDMTRRALMALAWALHDQNRDKEALPYVQRWMEGEGRRLEAMLSFGTADQRVRWLHQQFPCELPVSLGLARETATLLLHTKGIIFDLMLGDRREAEAARTEEGRTLWEQVTDLRTQMRRELDEPKPSKNFAVLRDRFLQLDARLSKLTGARTTLHEALATTVEQVQEKLPEDAALLDFFAVPARERGGRWVSRYGVVVVRHGREPKLVLSRNTQAQVDELAGYFRPAMQAEGDSKKKDEALDTLHHALYEMMLETAEPELQGVKKLYLCPDGSLQFVPFATLLDKDGRFLAERFEIRQLTSARDLLRRKPAAAPERQRSIDVFGDATYRLAANTAETREATPSEKARVADFLNERNGALISQLPGTKRELELITSHATASGWKPHVFRAAEATEERLRTLAPPQCLHLATHGYFLVSNFELAAAKRLDPRLGDSRRPDHSAVLDPNLTRTGLLLTGASDTLALWRDGRAVASGKDGIFTGQEVAELNLNGTQLVVLSACDTGAGAGIVSTGVLGLRTAFLYSGAQHVISTLWPIPDVETAEFMGAFYHRYLKTGQPGTSLHETQRDWLVRVRKSQGLWQAVRQAGAFIFVSTGTED